VPRLAGRYELKERLGEGGMAEVWLATSHGDSGFTRRVAIKQLFPVEADGGAFERMFLDEARITSRLHHAAIVSILDFGVEAGRPFQVLELVDGFDVWRLSKWGRATGKPLSPGLALHVCAVVGHALHFAHVAVDDEGQPLRIVHRDVSPQNVLVSRSGDVKLSDFGIAFSEGRAEQTVGGIARGKPAYMAPEQAVRGAMDGRTDVFGLGCVLHALISGESALRDENALVDLLAGVELRLDASLPEPVREIVARATRRNKAERYDSAEEMALACTQLIPTFLSVEPRTALSAWVKEVAPAVNLGVANVATPVLSKPPVPAQRRRWPWVVGLGLVGVALGGLSTLVPRELPEPVLELEPPAASPVKTEPKVIVPPPPEPAPERVPEPVVKVVPKKPAAPVATGTGVFAVGGELFLRGEIFIDGASRGFAPNRLELPVGAHRVEVVGRDGVRHGPREIVVNRQHTQSAPLSWEQ
jgi:serine/threonine protein kinase